MHKIALFFKKLQKSPSAGGYAPRPPFASVPGHLPNHTPLRNPKFRLRHCQ